MTDKEKILAEIQKRIEFQKICIKNNYRLTGRAEEEIIFEYQKLINFINSLPKEPISKDLEQAIDTYLATYFGGEKEKQDWPFLKKMAIHFANWQLEQLKAKAIDGHVTFEFYGLDSKTYGTIAHDPICLDDLGLKDTDKVKVILIKED